MGDGCVYEISASCRQQISPCKLRLGGYVKLLFWLPAEDCSILIELAEVQWVKDRWIKVEFIKVNPSDQGRIEQFLAIQTHLKRHMIATRDQVLPPLLKPLPHLTYGIPQLNPGRAFNVGVGWC